MSNQEDPRVQADREELAERIAQAHPGEGVFEPQPGIKLGRTPEPTELVHGFYEPSLCVIAQGAKVLSLRGEDFRYDPAHYLVSTVGLPMTAQVVEASPRRPYLSLRLVLDPAVVTSVMVESGLVQKHGEGGSVKGIEVDVLDADLLNATLRLMRLVENPEEYRVLSPLVIREIVYRLLMSDQGYRMQHLATFGGQANRMVQAIRTIRENLDKPLRNEEVAKELGMSLSGFHAHFKAVTGMSPLQFHKQLRLQEAQRLMVDDAFDAAEAGFRVGYEDPSYFNRDYKRQFGEPPARHVEGLRGTVE